MDSALFVIDPDGSQINFGSVRSVERVLNDYSKVERYTDMLGYYHAESVMCPVSESFSFSLYCSTGQYMRIHEAMLYGSLLKFKAVTPENKNLCFSGHITDLAFTIGIDRVETVELGIEVISRVTCESIQDINKMSNFEILEFLHKRLALGGSK